MDARAKHEAEFAAVTGLLLEIARERSTDALLQKIVQRLSEQPRIPLARVWLVGPGDICPACPMEPHCPDRSSCLRLVASAGRAVEEHADEGPGEDDLQRLPLGLSAVGQIAVSGEPLEVTDLLRGNPSGPLPDWARRAGVRGFAGQPLSYQGKVLGVLAVFTRARLRPEGLLWLRMIADHAAAAIANARAFEEIERLKQRLELERDYLREEVREAHHFGDIVGQSPALLNIMTQIELVAPTDASVLILGESGTGKELVAREIHKRSPRRDHPMIKANCAAVPRELYESEFFGHVKGAFTGAIKDRAGRFELADGGSLFLDEVGEIPRELQSKLLRVLQEEEFERVGDASTRRVNVRIIAATNHDLKQEVEQGRFRQDLYYRLNVFPIDVPPLRRRKEDIPLLAARFMERAALRFNCPLPRLTQGNILQLQQYDWPGNVRELQNVIERAVITAHSGILRFDLPQESSGKAAIAAPAAAAATAGDGVLPETEIRRRERENMDAALRRCGGRIYGRAGAAELLGLRPTTLASRVRKLGLKKR